MSRPCKEFLTLRMGFSTSCGESPKAGLNQEVGMVSCRAEESLLIFFVVFRFSFVLLS